MLRTPLSQTLRVYFEVSTAGVPVTGLPSGAFTAAVLNPQNTTLVTPAPTVVESFLTGLYTFTIPSTFFATHGVGMYKTRIVIGAPGPAQVKELDVEAFDPEAEVQLSVTYDAPANMVRAHSWLRRDITQDLTGLQNATLRLYDRTGAALSTLQTTVAADAQSLFAFNFASPVFAVGETETYFVATIEQLSPPATPVRIYRSVVGATFSRTS